MWKAFQIKYGKFNFLIFQMDPLYLIFTTIWLNSQLRSSITCPVSLLSLLALYEGVVKLSRPCICLCWILTCLVSFYPHPPISMSWPCRWAPTSVLQSVYENQAWRCESREPRSAQVSFAQECGGKESRGPHLLGVYENREAQWKHAGRGQLHFLRLSRKVVR